MPPTPPKFLPRPRAAGGTPPSTAAVALATAITALTSAGSAAADPPALAVEHDRESGEVTVTARGEPGGLLQVERTDGFGGWAPAFRGESASGEYSETLPVSAAPAAFYRAAAGAPVTVEEINYRGWEGSYRISNGTVEATVVPAISRIMQFKFAGDSEEDIFWEKESEFGRPPSTGSWRNFGGDKIWPSPQGYFSRFTGRSWPPPSGFEQVAFSVTPNPEGDGITMVSPDESDYGMRVTRVVRLDPFSTTMEVETTFERVTAVADPNGSLPLSIWVVTQVNHSLGTFLPVPDGSMWESRGGYIVMSGGSLPEENLANVGGTVRVVRRTSGGFKIGSDAGSIVSVYPRTMLLMESPRVEGASYPRTERESSAQVYANGGGTDTYLEMEFHSPEEVYAVGDSHSATVAYTLLRRPTESTGEDDVLADARRALGQ